MFRYEQPASAYDRRRRPYPSHRLAQRDHVSCFDTCGRYLPTGCVTALGSVSWERLPGLSLVWRHAVRRAGSLLPVMAGVIELRAGRAAGGGRTPGAGRSKARPCPGADGDGSAANAVPADGRSSAAQSVRRDGQATADESSGVRFSGHDASIPSKFLTVNVRMTLPPVCTAAPTAIVAPPTSALPCPSSTRLRQRPAPAS